MAYLSTEEANKIIQSSLDTSRLVEFGHGLRVCDMVVLEANADAIIMQLSNLIKKEFHAFTLSAIFCVTKELLKRLSSFTSTPSSFIKLVTTIFLHHTSSTECQAVALHCLSSIASVFPSCTKAHQHTITEWAKKGLYSGHPQLVQESALLIATLHSSGKRPEDFSGFFCSSLELLQFLIQLLTGEETLATPSFYLCPTLPPKGQERLSSVVNAVKGITKLLCYCLALESTVDQVTVPVYQVMNVVWLAIECKVMAPSLGVLVKQVSWQFLLAVIQRCNSHLLPYSEIIEAGIVRTLQNDPPPLIISLVCECANKWIEVRGHAYLFVENLVINISLIGHKLMKDLVQNGKKGQVHHKGTDMWLLYHCWKTLGIYLHGSHLDLPPKVIKAVNILGRQTPTSYPSKIVLAAKELIALTEGLMNTAAFNLREEVVSKQSDSIISKEIEDVTKTWTSQQMETIGILGSPSCQLISTPTLASACTSSSNTSSTVKSSLLSKRLSFSSSFEDRGKNPRKVSKTIVHDDSPAGIHKNNKEDSEEDEEIEVVDIAEEDLLMDMFRN